MGWRIAWTVLIAACASTTPSTDAGADASASNPYDANVCSTSPPGDICTTSNTGFCGPGTSIPCGSACYWCGYGIWQSTICDCHDAGLDGGARAASDTSIDGG